jgi:hypothetical protein
VKIVYTNTPNPPPQPQEFVLGGVYVKWDDDNRAFLLSECYMLESARYALTSIHGGISYFFETIESVKDHINASLVYMPKATLHIEREVSP